MERTSTPGPPSADLLARVRDGIDALEANADAPGTAVKATTVLRGLRDAVDALRADHSDRPAWRALAHRILESAMHRPVRAAFEAAPFGGEWTDLLLEAAHVSDFTVGAMFLARARQMGDRTLFLLPPDRREGRLSWDTVANRVLGIGSALLTMRKRGDLGPEGGPVAMLSANSPEVAIFDLACLVTGIPNVPVPANSQPSQVAWILQHSGAQALFLGDPVLAAVARESGALPRFVHWLDPELDPENGIASFTEFLARGGSRDDDAVRQSAMALRSEDVATTMYTSGTTGDPKGVPFTHANLVTKRFARAAAWPDLGEGDVFLCYLPLYHTFGRWLEMLGCVFWGAVYAFVDDTSVDSLMFSFRRVRPTTFISVPKRWIQIAESVAPLSADLEPDPERDREISRGLQAATGGRLRRGLSAAGYLPPTVFRRFHAAGIQLHSGFGMTEATGGITMTPANDYRDDSIGVALPGIELKVADDGELLIRGPYVTPLGSDEAPRDEGWFATGDIVTADDDGHLRIVDRKKEIFKNVAGETISPRRVESLFADFDVVERVLLVGDRRDYCTVLIVPSAELRHDFADESGGLTLDSPELREMFAPIVSTVNRFLAPYERIIDFAILSRDLDPERGELTAKGTPKRNLVAERFREAIDPMYSRERVLLDLPGLAVAIPHWLLRQTGIHSRALVAKEDGIAVRGGGRQLRIRRLSPARVLVGDLVYDPGGDELRLGEILGRAELWVGNDAARRFAGPGIDHWWRRGRRFAIDTRLVERPPLSAEEAERAPLSLASDMGLDVATLHALACALRRPDAADKRTVVEVLRTSITGESPEIDTLVRELLTGAITDRDVRAECLRALIPSFPPGELDERVASLLDDPTFLDDREIEVMSRAPLREDQLERLTARAERLAEEGREEPLARLLDLLGRQAIEHPASHLRIRSLMAGLVDAADRPETRTARREQLGKIVRGFRAQLEPPRLALGFTWDEAVEFRSGVEPGDAERILEALRETTLLAEAVTLLGPGSGLARPEPLGPGSLRVTFLGTGTGRRVHLLEWFPASGDEPGLECILKVNRDLDWEQVQEELRLLVRARSGPSARPVVKTQGGGYKQQGLWTEEFIPGETLDHLTDRLATESDPTLPGVAQRLLSVWPFLVTNSASLVIDFWRRTGRVVTLAEPTAEKVVLPGHDWQIGGRLVSVADRKPCTRLVDVLADVHAGIVLPMLSRHPRVALANDVSLLLSAAFEVLGSAEALAALEAELPEGVSRGLLEPEEAETFVAAAWRFVSSVRRRGFLPGRVRLAARRYRRWAQLNPDATLEARATTLDQIEDAYGLGDLDAERPGSRLQLFRHTVFRGGEDEFVRALDELVARVLAGEGAPDEWRSGVGSLRESFRLPPDEEFFLARMLYPHVDPRGRAVLTRDDDLEGAAAVGVSVEQVDRAGERLHVRRPANPNETNALYRIFRASNFRQVPTGPEHDLLVATDDAGRVVGGLIFRRESEKFARLLWVVVSRHRRGRGVGAALVRELMSRLRAQGTEAVATGFFRPAFFHKLGFGVDPRYAGLVRTLPTERADPA